MASHHGTEQSGCRIVSFGKSSLTVVTIDQRDGHDQSAYRRLQLRDRIMAPWPGRFPCHVVGAVDSTTWQKNCLATYRILQRTRMAQRIRPTGLTFRSVHCRSLRRRRLAWVSDTELRVAGFLRQIRLPPGRSVERQPTICRRAQKNRRRHRDRRH